MALKKLLRAFVKYKKKGPAFCSAVVVAAGQASRMQGEDKIIAELGGEPVIFRTLEVFQICDSIQEIIVVVRPDRLDEISALCSNRALTKVRMVVPGGETRVDSVLNGLAHVSEKATLAAIHDGARPLVTGSIIRNAVNRARITGAAAPAVQVKDTIKVASCDIVNQTPDRSTLYAVQTPQVFDVDLLKAALCKAKEDGTPITDDCSAVEALGMSVHLTEGSDENLKITTPLDLVLANVIWNRRRQG